MSLDQYFLKGSDRMPKAKKIAPKSSTIGGVEQDVNMEDASANSRDEESSNSNFAQVLDKLTENITKVIDEKVNTVLSAINDQTVQFQALVDRVGEAEERIAGVENSTECLQATVADLQKKVSDMSAHIDDLENRGRRCNLRILGLPEGTEGSDPVHFFEKWLPDYLKITTKAGRIKLDRAHRSLAPLPGPAQRPRPVIIKFHNFTDKQRVLTAARHVGTDPERSADAGPRISFFNDYSAMVIKKRKAFDDVKKRLQKMKIEYALLYPATLRLTINGTMKRFASPDDVTVFIDSLG